MKKCLKPGCSEEAEANSNYCVVHQPESPRERYKGLRETEKVDKVRQKPRGRK
jgi:hypothetical protein